MKLVDPDTEMVSQMDPYINWTNFEVGSFMNENEDSKLSLGDSITDPLSSDRKPSLDELDYLLSTSTQSSGNNSLAELKSMPLPPITSITGMRDYHSFAANNNNHHISCQETNNNTVDTTNQNNLPYYGDVSSSTPGIDCGVVKQEINPNYGEYMDEEIATIISEAIDHDKKSADNDNWDDFPNWLDESYLQAATSLSPPITSNTNIAKIQQQQHIVDTSNNHHHHQQQPQQHYQHHHQHENTNNHNHHHHQVNSTSRPNNHHHHHNATTNSQVVVASTTTVSTRNVLCPDSLADLVVSNQQHQQFNNHVVAPSQHLFHTQQQQLKCQVAAPSSSTPPNGGAMAAATAAAAAAAAQRSRQLNNVVAAAAAVVAQQQNQNSSFAHSMPLLQNRLQNGPPPKVTVVDSQEMVSAGGGAYQMVSAECTSPSSSTSYLAHSPPCHVVSTSDLGGYIPVHSSTTGPSPELQSAFPHTTTPGKKCRSRTKPKVATTIMCGDGSQSREKTMHHCHICNRGFLNKSNIKVHLRTHTGEKPFRCDTCGKAFRQKAHLLKHAQIHRRVGRD